MHAWWSPLILRNGSVATEQRACRSSTTDCSERRSLRSHAIHPKWLACEAPALWYFGVPASGPVPLPGPVRFQRPTSERLTQNDRYLRHAAVLMGWLVAGAIVWLSLKHQPPQWNVQNGDKLQHAL